MKIEKAGDTLNIDTELFTITQTGSVVKVDIQGLIVEKDVETGVYSINTIESESVVTEPEGEDWIKWEGGVCPLKIGTKIDVKYRSGKVVLGTNALVYYRGVTEGATREFWKHDNHPNDIVFYRLSK